MNRNELQIDLGNGIEMRHYRSTLAHDDDNGLRVHVQDSAMLRPTSAPSVKSHPVAI